MKIEKIIKETVKDLGGVLLQICAITMICYQIKNDALLNMLKSICILNLLLGLYTLYINNKKYKKRNKINKMKENIY